MEEYGILAQYVNMQIAIVVILITGYIKEALSVISDKPEIQEKIKKLLPIFSGVLGILLTFAPNIHVDLFSGFVSGFAGSLGFKAVRDILKK